MQVKCPSYYLKNLIQVNYLFNNELNLTLFAIYKRERANKQIIKQINSEQKTIK